VRFRTVPAALLFLACAVAPAGPQTQPEKPQDPPLIDARGYAQLIESHRGKPLLVNFWATWCEPCRAEYPMLNELAKEYGPKGLRVLGISLDDEGEMLLVRRFLAKYQPVFPNYRKSAGKQEEFVKAVNPQWKGALPATFLYTADGRQLRPFTGAGSREQFEAAIRSLLSRAGTLNGEPPGRKNP